MNIELLTFYIVVLIIIVSVAIVSIVVFFADKQPDIRFSKDFIQITGMFGMIIHHAEIASVIMTNDKLPSMFKTWGLCFLGINKGDFDIYDKNEEYEVGEGCKLYTQTNKPPFILITLTNDLKIFINFRNKTLMKKYYSELLKYVS